MNGNVVQIFGNPIFIFSLTDWKFFTLHNLSEDDSPIVHEYPTHVTDQLMELPSPSGHFN